MEDELLRLERLRAAGVLFDNEQLEDVIRRHQEYLDGPDSFSDGYIEFFRRRIENDRKSMASCLEKIERYKNGGQVPDATSQLDVEDRIALLTRIVEWERESILKNEETIAIIERYKQQIKEKRGKYIAALKTGDPDQIIAAKIELTKVYSEQEEE
ncbi:MAG TPA: hypothetical protein VEC13_01425 [Candidatus Paceibacterota bacterium]|nr:hypothetical protein [Candidatus Paceibacterota bacterium]